MDDRICEFVERQTSLGREIYELQKSVESGEVTLGNLDDFVFVNFGINPSLWRSFEDLQERVENSRGEEVLIACEEKVRLENRQGGGYPMKLCNINLDLAVGVLSGNGMNFDLRGGEIGFPTGEVYVGVSARYVSSGEVDLEGASVAEIGGVVRRIIRNLPHLYEHEKIKDLFSIDYLRSSQILIGSEVAQYFDTAMGGCEVYQKVRDFLEKS